MRHPDDENVVAAVALFGLALIWLANVSILYKR